MPEENPKVKKDNNLEPETVTEKIHDQQATIYNNKPTTKK